MDRCNIFLKFFFPGCSVEGVKSELSFYTSHVIADLFQLCKFFHHLPVITIMCFLIWPAPAILSIHDCPDGLVILVYSWPLSLLCHVFPIVAVLLSCPFLAVISWLSCYKGSPVVYAFPSRLSRLGFSAIIVLSWLSSQNFPVRDVRPTMAVLSHCINPLAEVMVLNYFDHPPFPLWNYIFQLPSDMQLFGFTAATLAYIFKF